MTVPEQAKPRKRTRDRGAARPSIEVRSMGPTDYFVWQPLFAQHVDALGESSNDGRALGVWRHVASKTGNLEGMIAFVEGEPRGYVLFRERLDIRGARTVLNIEAKYSGADSNRAAVNEELLGAVFAAAAKRGFDAISWLVDAEDEVGLQQSARMGSRSDEVRFEISVDSRQQSEG
ncbi:MAG: hypothetical protein ACTIA6_08950 [Pseudoclavibacter sp.]